MDYSRVVGCCEHGNEDLSSIKAGNLLICSANINFSKTAPLAYILMVCKLCNVLFISSESVKRLAAGWSNGLGFQ
jgi:hypothetical protein